MDNTFNISVILPLHSSKIRDFDEFFKKAITSITTQKVLPKEVVIVHTDEESLVEYLNSFNFENLNVKKVLYQGESNYSSQINLGIKEASSEWISFFEFDDEYSQIWFNNVKKYSEIYTRS